jgi:hypothetical protein
VNYTNIDPSIKSLYKCFLSSEFRSRSILWRIIQLSHAVNSTCEYTLHLLYKYANNHEMRRIVDLLEIDEQGCRIDWVKFGTEEEEKIKRKRQETK